MKPRASRAALARDAEGGWVLSVTAPPVDGAANAAVLAFFSGALSVKKADVSIVAGETGRAKIVEIRGLGVDEGTSRLAEIAR